MKFDNLESLSIEEIENLYDLNQGESLSWCACLTSSYSSIRGCNLRAQGGALYDCAVIIGPIYNGQYCIDYCQSVHRCSVLDWYSGTWTNSTWTCTYNRYS